MRIRLEFHPHDKEAHHQLTSLLEKKYAFRALVAEDASWVKNNPNDSYVEVIRIISFSKVALHDPEFAIAQLRSYLVSVARKDDPENYDNLVNQLANLLEDRGRHQEAVPFFAELVRLNPEEAGFWLDYGVALSSAGRHVEAVQALHRSIDLNSSLEANHEWLGEVLLRTGDLKGSEIEYRASLSIYESQYKSAPTNSYNSMISGLVKIEGAHHEEHVLAQIQLKLAHVLLLEKKYDEAIAQTEAALEADHNEFAALYLRAVIYDAKGDHKSASRTREVARATIQKEVDNEFRKSGQKPDIDPQILFLSDSLWNKESGYPAFPTEILTILEPRTNTLSAAENTMLAMAYFALNRPGDAKQAWERAKAADPNFDTAYGNYNLGQRLLKADAFREALPHLERAYVLDPQNVTFRMDYENTKRKTKD